MRLFLLFVSLMLVLNAGTESSTIQLVNELKTKRESLGAIHQEFQVTRTYKLATTSQSAKWSVVLDSAGPLWHEKSIAGSGNHTSLFDGTDLFNMEDSEAEYVRVHRSSKEDDPLPEPYSMSHPDWSKVVERGRVPCQIPNLNHQCVVLEFPLKPWIRNAATPATSVKIMGGSSRIVMDTETGLILSSRSVQAIDNGRGGYQSDIAYVLTRMTYGGPKQESLFQLPSSDMKEVKEITRWNAAKIMKQLGGRAAPEFAITDLQGKPITLSSLKGKMVLLDFWATWCGPCRADGPALDQLYRKYGDKEVAIVGISVDEDRPVVQKFLGEHPHNYPIVLTSENEMPRAYQIGAFPTYIVVDKDGNIAAATEGEKGFGSLRKLLKKAGLDAE